MRSESADHALTVGGAMAEDLSERSIREQEMGNLAMRVYQRWPSLYAGSDVGVRPGETPRLHIVGSAPAKLGEVVLDAPVDVELVDGAPLSFAQQEEQTIVVANSLRAAGFYDIVVGTDLRTGRTDAQIGGLDLARVDNAEIIRLLPSGLRQVVDVQLSASSISQLEDAFGGMRLRNGPTNRCTSGFSVVSETNERGISTAGHCSGINRVVEPGQGVHVTSWELDHVGQWGDVEWHTTTEAEPALFYSDTNAVRHVRSLRARPSLGRGDRVCLYGRSSNNADCADITQVSISCGRSDRIVQVGDDLGVPGDSGGPWYNHSTAFGLHRGNCGSGREGFTPVDLMDEAIDVRVLAEDRVATGQILGSGGGLRSPNGVYTLLMQTDGNLVLYRQGGVPVWSTGTSTPGTYAIMQTDGNFVLYRPGPVAVWSTSTGARNSNFILQDDGNLVILSNSYRVQWASNTSGA